MRKIAKFANKVHWIKIVIKKERDRGGVPYYKIGAHVKTQDKLYVGYSEPGGTRTMMAKRGEGDIVVKEGKRRWDFIDVLKDALLSVESQIEEDRGRRRSKNKQYF